VVVNSREEFYSGNKRKIIGTAFVAALLVGCGGGGGNTEDCKALADLEALVKPDGYNFDEDNDGYMNGAERMREFSNEDLKQDLIDLRDIYPDC